MKITRFYLLVLVVTFTNVHAAPNFDLINADPKTPIHVTANGGPWQTLDQQHYRYPINVPENSLLVMSLSANDDKSAPTSLIFAPERALDVAKQVGSQITKAPTFYVAAQVITEKIPGSDKTAKHVKLTPQKSVGKDNKTKSGLPLDNNVTQEMIDIIVGIAESDTQEPEEQSESRSSTQQISEPQTHAVTELVQQPAVKKMEAPFYGPTTPTTALQHKDTPQMILATLKKITKDNANAKAQWIEIRTYLVGQQANDLFKDHDDVSIYNQLIEHYKTLKAQTKFQLHKTYTRITEIITETYKVARP